MDDKNVTPAETTDQPQDAVTRSQKITAIRDFADWLADNPAVVVPNLTLTRHLQNDYDGTESENLDTVRAVAASLGTGTDESLDDRTVLRVRVNKHVRYELFAWHKAGRGHRTELDRLRAEVAELRAARKPLVSDETIAEAGAMEARDRAAGGPPWEVPEHPENFQPGGWHHGQLDPTDGDALVVDGGKLVDETPKLVTAERAREIVDAGGVVHRDERYSGDYRYIVDDMGALGQQEPGPCYVPSGFHAPEVVAEMQAQCVARHPGRECR